MKSLPARVAGSTPVLIFVFLGLTWGVGPGVANPSVAPWLAPTTDGRGVTLPPLDPQLPSPAQVLGYPLGADFTPHHRIVDYLEILAEASPRVTLRSYGETYEGRPLLLAFVSSADNISRLDTLAADRRVLGDPGGLTPDQQKQLVERSPAVLWLSYGVHGNESSSAEAALATAYVLAAAEGEFAQQLDDVLVIIDPLVNPDGRERYVHGFASRRGVMSNPQAASREHQESWPRGRGNHYGVDLNRDWAWVTQTETRQRLVPFRTWEPQVFVDFHEMGARSSYFFPPPAEPVHPRIGENLRSWLDTFGRGNAQAFDTIGWTYYVEEQFDLFYPGYGDSYPTLRGAVGMTYEVGGGGRAGALIEFPDGRRKSLADRVGRHLASSLATFETTVSNSRGLVRDFAQRRRAEATRHPNTFLWSSRAPEGRALAETLTEHGIRVRRLVDDQTIEGQRVATDVTEQITLSQGDYLVMTNQPLGTLAETLMEREAALPSGFVGEQRRRVEEDLDPEFYDVTAWSLPLAFNLPVWRLEGSLSAPVTTAVAAADLDSAPFGQPPVASSVGYIIPAAGIATYRLAAAIDRAGLHYRFATEPFRLGGRDFPPGSLVVAVEDQSAAVAKDLNQTLSGLSLGAAVEIISVDSSWTSRGADLGSDRFEAIRSASIGLIAGEGISDTSLGALWHLLDRDLEIPYSLLDLDHLERLPLNEFDSLVLPDIWDSSRLGEATAQRLDAWVRQGGVLVTLGSASGWTREVGLTEGDDGGSSEGETDPEGEESGEESGPLHYVPGAFVATQITLHPLTAGLSSPPPWLFLGTIGVAADTDPQNDLLTIRDDHALIAGFAWPEATERLPGAVLVTYSQHGNGKVITFAQDPTFRLFTRGTMPLLLNAVMMAPSW
ncbi:MAG: hypothetical protein K8J08_05365 [Thermoanaerobaculia bacterium]|nr:hypothetical protein [Thermoanaerobaculia bacterium]